MKFRNLVLLLSIAAIFTACNENPMNADSQELSLLSPLSGSRLLCGDTIAVSWSAPRASIVIEYLMARGEFGDTDPAWQAAEAVSQSETEARIVLPLEYADSLVIRIIDTANGDTTMISGTLNHFVLTEYPEAGSTHAVGDTVTIGWRASSLIGRAILMLGQEGGRTHGYITGQEAISMPQTRYSWIIGSDAEADISYPGTDYRVFIIEYDRFDWTDAMPGTFSITN